MDISNTTNIKTPEAESETPTRIQPIKPIFSNGLLKRHHHLATQTQKQPPPPPLQPPHIYIYRDCLKNHAAAIGGHALDGCGEFMLSPTSNPTDPTSLKCAACNCHRNFHRREINKHSQNMIEYHSPNRHQPPPPPPPPPHADSPSSPSPPPISSSYYPASAPHMLLALSAGPQPELVGHHHHTHTHTNTTTPVTHSNNNRKRFRTKFTQQQKGKMLEFAGKVGWKIQKKDEAAITSFCTQIGVERGVLKVWMHNNKSTLGKRSSSSDYNNNNENQKKTNNNSSNENQNASCSGSEEKNNNIGVVNGNGSSSSS